LLKCGTGYLACGWAGNTAKILRVRICNRTLLPVSIAEVNCRN
jgi:hypothetical protein